MKKMFFALTLVNLSLLVAFFCGVYWRAVPAEAITNITYQNMQEQVLSNQQTIMNNQHDLAASLNTLQAAFNKLSGELGALKAANNENKAALQKVQEASRESINVQNQLASKLTLTMNDNQEKTLKAIELIYEVLQKNFPATK